MMLSSQKLILNSKTKILAYLFFFGFSFAFSYLLSSFYQLGDQIVYRAFYEELSTAAITEILSLQAIHTGSGEPLYGLIAWAGSNLSIEKDLYFSAINTLLLYFLLKFLLINSARKTYIILTFLNFYLLVLIGPAERLKLAFLFSLAAVTAISTQTRYIFHIAALLSHFQTTVLVLCWFSSLFARMSFRTRIKKKTLTVVIISCTAISLISWIFFSLFLSSILNKVEHYANQDHLFELLNIAALMIITTFIFKNKAEILLPLATTAIIANIVGSDRINMTAFIIFSYFVVIYKKTSNPIVIILMSYFAVKGILFSIDVFTRGTGF